MSVVYELLPLLSNEVKLSTFLFAGPLPWWRQGWSETVYLLEPWEVGKGYWWGHICGALLQWGHQQDERLHHPYIILPAQHITWHEKRLILVQWKIYQRSCLPPVGSSHPTLQQEGLKCSDLLLWLAFLVTCKFCTESHLSECHRLAHGGISVVTKYWLEDWHCCQLTTDLIISRFCRPIVYQELLGMLTPFVWPCLVRSEIGIFLSTECWVYVTKWNVDPASRPRASLVFWTWFFFLLL